LEQGDRRSAGVGVGVGAVGALATAEATQRTVLPLLQALTDKGPSAQV